MRQVEIVQYLAPKELLVMIQREAVAANLWKSNLMRKQNPTSASQTDHLAEAMCLVQVEIQDWFLEHLPDHLDWSVNKTSNRVLDVVQYKD